MHLANRRNFLQASVLAGSALAGHASAIEPIRRHGKSHMQLSLAAYSFREYLNLKRQPKPSMALEDFVEVAATMPFDAVELTAYYFATTSAQYLANLKGRCTKLGLDVS